MTTLWHQDPKILLDRLVANLNTQSKNELVAVFKKIDHRVSEIENSPDFQKLNQNNTYSDWLEPWSVLAAHFSVEHPIEFEELIASGDRVQLGLF